MCFILLSEYRFDGKERRKGNETVDKICRDLISRMPLKWNKEEEEEEEEERKIKKIYINIITTNINIVVLINIFFLKNKKYNTPRVVV